MTPYDPSFAVSPKIRLNINSPNNLTIYQFNNLILFIDSHAHLDFSHFQKDLPQVLENAEKANVKKIITVGCNIGSSKQCLKLARKHENIYATVGIHPSDILEGEQQTKQLLQLENYLEDLNKIVAVGEIGLDYHWMTKKPEIQQEMFKNQLAMGFSRGLPIIVHCRNNKDNSLNAYEDALDIIEQELKENPAPIKPKIVFHCFSGTLEFAQKIWDLGYLTSFTGTITYPKADETKQVAKNAPNNQIMIETDCPFLSPQPFRGQRNEPAYVIEVAKQIAELKSIELAELESILEQNTRGFFGI